MWYCRFDFLPATQLLRPVRWLTLGQMSAQRDTDDRLARLIEYFAERLNGVYSHFLCKLVLQEDEDIGLARSKESCSLKSR